MLRPGSCSPADGARAGGGGSGGAGPSGAGPSGSRAGVGRSAGSLAGSAYGREDDGGLELAEAKGYNAELEAKPRAPLLDYATYYPTLLPMRPPGHEVWEDGGGGEDFQPSTLDAATMQASQGGAGASACGIGVARAATLSGHVRLAAASPAAVLTPDVAVPWLGPFRKRRRTPLRSWTSLTRRCAPARPPA